MKRWLLLLFIIFVCCILIVRMSKAGGDILPLAVDSWVYGSASTADGVNVANVTVSCDTRTSTTNTSGDWGFYYPLGANQVYTLDIQLPEGYTMTDALGPGVTGWDQDSFTFQTGAVGALQGPYQLVISQMIYPTETPPPYLQPPSIWPWPIIVPSDADCMAIATQAREVRGQELEPMIDMQDNKLWQIGHKYQLGAQLGPEFTVFGAQTYRCIEFTQGIVILGQDDIGFGVVSPFGAW